MLALQQGVIILYHAINQKINQINQMPFGLGCLVLLLEGLFETNCFSHLATLLAAVSKILKIGQSGQLF